MLGSILPLRSRPSTLACCIAVSLSQRKLRVMQEAPFLENPIRLV